LHLAVAPVGSVFPAVAEAVDFAAAGAAAGGAFTGAGAATAAGAVLAAAPAAGAAAAAFLTPPWPLHAPRPVAVDVVPSLQVVGVLESAAWPSGASINTNKGPAMIQARFLVFIRVLSLD